MKISNSLKYQLIKLIMIFLDNLHDKIYPHVLQNIHHQYISAFYNIHKPMVSYLSFIINK